MPHRRFRAAGSSVVVLALTVLSGCATGSAMLVASPVSTEDQQARILEIAPVGTPREEALAALRKAGVEAHRGASETIYYCDIWNRPGGERWHLDVALLFDRKGRVYRTRSAEALVDRTDDERGAGGDARPSHSPEMPSTSLTGAASPIGEAAFPSDSGQSARSSRGSSPRVPFGK